jgi:hypothetical protein
VSAAGADRDSGILLGVGVPSNCRRPCTWWQAETPDVMEC